MMDDICDEAELAQFEALADAEKRRLNAKSAKEGTTTFEGTIESYKTSVKEKDGKIKTLELPHPGDIDWRVTEDGKRYPAKLPINVLIDEVVAGEDVSEISDGVFEFQDVKVDYMGATKDFLKRNAKDAWEAEQPSDLQRRIKIYVDSEGNVITTRKMQVSRGSIIKVKVADGEDSIFRSKMPKNKDVYFIQPTTPVKFFGIFAEDWVKAEEVEVEVEEEKGKKTKRKEWRLFNYPGFVCGSGVDVDPAYDPEMATSERLHENKVPYPHFFVQWKKVASGEVPLPKSGYLYLKHGGQSGVDISLTPEERARQPGAMVMMLPLNPQQDLQIKQQGGKIAASLRFQFVYFQWTGQKKTDEAYSVTINAWGDHFWRQYGIPYLNLFQAIVGCNRDLPVHLQVEVWDGKTREHEGNRKILMDEVSSDDDPMHKNIQGYYVGGATSVVVDYLRYFRLKGMRISKERVLKEFDNWVKTARNGRNSIELKAVDQTIQNPLHGHGLASPVICLGNGLLQKAGDEDGLFHCFTGNIMALFQEDTHDFFVLTNQKVEGADVANYCGPQARVLYADGWLDGMIQTRNAMYVIYAVQKNAKMGNKWIKQQERVLALEAARREEARALPAPTGEKRERTEEEEQSGRPSKIQEVE